MMRSGIREIVREFRLGEVEDGHAVAAQPLEKNDARDIRQLCRASGGELAQFVQFDCGGHPDLAGQLVRRFLQRPGISSGNSI